MQALVVAAEHEQPAVDDHGGSLQRGVGNEAGGKAVQLARAALRPDFGAEQSQAHLHQPVVEMAEDHVVASHRQGLIEHDRADVAGVRMGEALGTQRPTAGERR